eukprot:m.278433 g.278433  ORF g.278433 m.278433 type:complete len:881 (+) comp16315_c0_seq25:207-2849(+)
MFGLLSPSVRRIAVRQGSIETVCCYSRQDRVRSRQLPAKTLSSGPRTLAAQQDADQRILPREARVVVVGGGIIGTSVAYHLAKLGWSDVVLLEKDKLTSGTTWHAAGLMVTYGSLSETSTEIRKYSKALYSALEKETGQNTGIMNVGFIELATNKDRLEEYRRVAAFNRKCGVDVQEISGKEVEGLFPLCRSDDILAGFYVEDDGRVNPVDVTMALGKGARMHGAKIFENTAATGVLTKNKRVTGVTAQRQGGGEEVINCEFVVNCAGMWARQFGELAGVTIPNQAAEHYYLLTDIMPEVSPEWPVIEDPASYTYIRPEGVGLLIGLFEPEGAAWNVNNIPEFSFGEIEPDWERMSPYLERAMSRVPASLNVGAKKFFCGPESFTPDLGPIVGEAPELRNYFVAAGMNSIGILSGGGIGRLLATWIKEGKPDMDVTGMNIDRFHPYQSTPAYRSHRVTESLGLVYKCHYPYRPSESARGVKRSPLHAHLKQAGAYFRDVSGWEGADWYGNPEEEQTIHPLSFGRHHWFENWASEHKACRESVALFDMSFMSKFEVSGEGAGDMLNKMSTSNVDGLPGVITYTQWLNDDGKVEADLTVSKIARDKFFVVATDTMHRHVQTLMERMKEDYYNHVHISDVTGAYAQINIQGPRSRELLQMLSPENNVSDQDFPFRAVRTLDIGYAPVTVARITYVGELGYEIYVPTEMAGHVYEMILQHGESVGLRHAGLKALGSLRLEKGYRDYGHDVDNTDTVIQAGLGFTCDFDKPGGFIGKDSVLAEKERGIPCRRVLQVLVQDPEPLLFHGEVLLRNGEQVGDVRAGSYGHTLGGAVGLAFVHSSDGTPVNKKYINEGKWEIDIAGKKYPVTVSIRPLLDPANERIKQ